MTCGELLANVTAVLLGAVLVGLVAYSLLKIALFVLLALHGATA